MRFSKAKTLTGETQTWLFCYLCVDAPMDKAGEDSLLFPLLREFKGEKLMKSKVGLWMDHEKAVIVFVSCDAQEQSQVNLN